MTDYQSKIQEHDFDSLCRTIMADARSADMLACRYAVRFVMLDNFDTFRRLREFLMGNGVKLLQFDTLLEDDVDGWLTPDQLRREMQQCTEATLITPFSELVRFYDEQKFCGFMHDISLMEDTAHPHKRLYVPLIGMENRMLEFLKGFGRLRESAPIWSCHSGRQETRVYLMEHSTMPQNSHITVLHNAKEWLQYWKTQAPQEVVVCTALPIRAYHAFSQPDNIFSFIPIDTTYQLFTQMMGYHFPFAWSEKEAEEWDTLLGEVVNIPAAQFSFGDYVCRRFGVMSIDATRFIELWERHDVTDFDRWLLRGYAFSDGKFTSQTYLRECLDASDLSSSDLLVKIATHIPLDYIGKRIDRLLIDERAMLMRTAGEKTIQDSVSVALQAELRKCVVDIFQQGDFATAKALCTHTFDFERQLAAGWFDLHEKDSFNRKDLEVLYPDLTAYLGNEAVDTPQGCGWMHDYFSLYRRGKLADSYIEGIKEMMSQQNGSSANFYAWYHATPRCHDLMEAAKADYVYWVDGLGAEYIPYLQYLVGQQSHYVVGRCCYARVDIPTSTQHNRYNLPQERIFCQLDEKAHDSHGYRKYDTLIEELQLLSEIINTILSNHAHEICRIAIVSDHGMSYLSRKVESLKYDKSAEHEGRFLRCDSKAVDDTDFVYHTNETDGQQYKVALHHASLGNRPTHEVHGGCTPEEVLVPFVLLVPSNEVVNYDIHLR